MFPIAFVFMMSVMGSYAKDYEGAVQATNELSSSMIEYINGIEVIKAFNQGKTSYARLAEKVRANAQYYFDWMRRSQLGMSMAYAFFPAQMLTVLPFGWLFYTHGTLSIGTFLTVIIDPENEAVIQKAVARLVADKTVTDIEAVCMILARAEYLVLPQRTRPKKQVEGRQELSALSACQKSPITIDIVLLRMGGRLCPPGRLHRFYGNLRRIRNFQAGRCRHRPLQSTARIHGCSSGGQRRPPLRQPRKPYTK